MADVRRHPRAPEHACSVPMRDSEIHLSASLNRHAVPTTLAITVVDGYPGDLWRCDDCGRLWRVVTQPAAGRGYFSPKWCPATLWQRIRYRRKGWPASPAHQPEKIQRGGTVLVPGAQIPPVQQEIPKPPPPSGGGR